MKNSMEVYQSLTPEFDDELEVAPYVHFEEREVTIHGDNKVWVSLTREQFEEAIKFYEAFKQAEGAMKNVSTAKA